MLTAAPSDLFEGPPLSAGSLAIVRDAPEGRYGDLTALAPPQQALIVGRVLRDISGRRSSAAGRPIRGPDQRSTTCLARHGPRSKGAAQRLHPAT